MNVNWAIMKIHDGEKKLWRCRKCGNWIFFLQWILKVDVFSSRKFQFPCTNFFHLGKFPFNLHVDVDDKSLNENRKFSWKFTRFPFAVHRQLAANLKVFQFGRFLSVITELKEKSMSSLYTSEIITLIHWNETFV